MTSIKNLARTAIILYAICFLTNSDGRPMMKRSVSEMQLMHNLGEHRHTVERQDWLQMKLQDVHSAFEDGRTQRPRNKDDVVLGETRSRRRLPEHLRAMQKKSIDLDKAYMDVLFKTKP
ncbi:Parathyroid hormone [Buceros rhinoceros silvestris]|uniref:Parathyroid hormone n=1 Tax=Buceros rhinoceros silvestris TaxID=175836 RepID=A0A091GUB0_BUCRH|nr:PREDICTED: parathyroid hormone [Buceros rhinoceros silvestris]KFO86769.1 Parathyroid hormone [Buceros rhinoceros silvestris]